MVMEICIFHESKRGCISFQWSLYALPSVVNDFSHGLCNLSGRSVREYLVADQIPPPLCTIIKCHRMVTLSSWEMALRSATTAPRMNGTGLLFQ
ncbi:hypothetical protein LOAG_01282 [Loa loa]|uniref:Uncharacterized protein n=1 Tax=Loa loa TaxID=7209 RepID=A0A1S0UBE8_LOALO|nr:hypothetical protein LOAG_01282 [Loa loa]EFO27195.2 hypothetical protein LOAG_01282 [Loa loa]